MSMAERMALKGKKFKIGKRKSTTASANVTAAQSGASTPAPTYKAPLAVMDEPKEAARNRSQHSEYLGNRSPSQSSARDASSQSPSPPPLVRRPPQPTVVRIGDTDSEADMSNSVSDSGSDGDIPARRGAGRGGRRGGRGRGRGRGRPRGSGRGY